MAKEIERKFLVCDSSYKDLASSSFRIMQGYLSDDPERTVRIRIKGDRGYLTIKGLTCGAMRDEWEYEVPVDDALDMLRLCRQECVVSKTRYLTADGWEIDEFHDRLRGLIIAEIELEDESSEFPRPRFIGREVTGDPRYYNSVLASCDCIPPTE